MVVMSIMGSVIRSLLMEMRQSRQAAIELQSHWLAEAAVARAAVRLKANPEYKGESWKVEFSLAASNSDDRSGVADIRVERGDEGQPTRVSVEAKYPDDPRRRARTERVLLISANH
jgi:type II secretory pathway pseudopilin PulG